MMVFVVSGLFTPIYLCSKIKIYHYHQKGGFKWICNANTPWLTIWLCALTVAQINFWSF